MRTESDAAASWESAVQRSNMTTSPAHTRSNAVPDLTSLPYGWPASYR